MTGDTRHDPTNDEVELTRYQGLDSFAEAVTRTHTYATGEDVLLESGASDFRNDPRIPWCLPRISPVPGFESILEIVTSKEAGYIEKGKD